MKRVREERSQPLRQSETDAAKSDFIAAARRAAQAAAAEAEVLKRGADIAGPVKALRVGDLLKSRRKPILMTSTAIIVALAGLQLGKSFMNDTAPMAALEVAPMTAPQPIETASLDEFPMPAEPLDLVDESIVTEAPAVEARFVGPKDEPTTATKPAAIVETTGQANSPIFEPSAKEALTKPAAMADAIKTAALPQAPAFVAPTPAFDVPAEAGPAPLREAATAGDAKALFEIASRYSEGRGGATDMAKAAQWYEKSAELGFAPAQFRIGNFYEKGLGVARDIGKSKSWYLKAAELGVKDSQFNLGILAAKGVGMPQSLEESYKWFALVAKTGDKDAAGKRDEIANSLQPDQLERARAATELWKPKPLEPNANAVDIPEAWQESQDKTASLDMKKAVQNIQFILNKNGYAAGEPDGVMGGKTKSAITAFQKDNALEPTGEVDEQLVAKLLKRK
jgi:localization factor PodJL